MDHTAPCRGTYICIDLKSFYASVECVQRRMDPLTTNLVVADETRSDKTICLAVSPNLKATYGLPGRARLFEVKQRLREAQARTGQEVPLVIAPPQMAKYIQVSSDIYALYLRYIAPEDIHVYSIDEVFTSLASNSVFVLPQAAGRSARRSCIDTGNSSARGGQGWRLEASREKTGIRIQTMQEQTRPHPQRRRPFSERCMDS